MVSIGAHSGILRCRLMTVTEDNVEEAKSLKPSWARFVRVIDVDATSKHKDLCELLIAWKIDHYETLRYTIGRPGKWSKLCEQPTRVAYLQNPAYTATGHFEGVRKKKIHISFVIELLVSGWGVCSPRFKAGQPKKAVVHHTPAASSESVPSLLPALITLSGLKGLRHVPLVVIFHKWGISATGDVSDDGGEACPETSVKPWI